MSGGYVDTERALLSAIITGTKETQDWVSSELTHKDFTKLEHQKAFKAIVQILDEGLEVNRISVKDRSRLSNSAMEDIMAYGAAGTGEIRTFINDIKGASAARFLDSVLSEAKASLAGSEAEPAKIIEQLESKLYGSSSGGLGVKDSLDAHDVARQVVKTLQDRVSGKGEPEVSTGLKALDKAILGFRPGKNLVIGARPGMGKSALAGTAAYNVVQQGYGALVCSAEMLEDEIMERGLAYVTDVNARKISSGKNISPEELASVLEAPSKIKPGYWKLNTTAHSLPQIRRVARIEKARMARKGIRLALVVVDYLQLYTGPEESAISDGSRHCKLMAQELGVTVLTLSQLNRGVEHRDDRRPLLSDLRGSGTIEQDGDIVIFLYRPGYYPDSNSNSEETECIVAKQRGGPTGTVKLRFIEKHARFLDYGPGTVDGGGGSTQGTDKVPEDGVLSQEAKANSDSIQPGQSGIPREPD